MPRESGGVDVGQCVATDEVFPCVGVLSERLRDLWTRYCEKSSLNPGKCARRSPAVSLFGGSELEIWSEL